MHVKDSVCTVTAVTIAGRVTVSTCNFWHTRPRLCALLRLDRDVRTQNVQLKRARTQLWHASMNFFYLRRRVYMSFFDTWKPLSVSPTLLLLTYKAAPLCNSLARPTCLHASLSTSCRSKSVGASLDRTAYRLYDLLLGWHKSDAAVSKQVSK